jgi:hypothetical protein
MRIDRKDHRWTVLKLERLEDRATPSAAVADAMPAPVATAYAAVSVSPTGQASPAATRTALTAAPAAPAAGRPLNLTIMVTPAAGSAVPAGTVTVKDGDKVLGAVGLQGGRAGFSTSGLAAGTHRLSAVYSGSTGFAGSTSAVLSVTIAPATPVGQAATRTALTASPAAPAAGRPLNLTIMVGPAAGSAVPAGTVTVKDGDKVLGAVSLRGGRAGFSTSGLAAGTHRLTAAYGGSPAFAASTTAVLTVTVAPAAAKAATTTTLSASAGSVVSGQPVTFTASVRPASGTGTSTGTVTFRDGSVIVGTVSLVGGSASLTLRSLSVGQHGVTAAYNGDDRFSTSTAGAKSVTVTRPAPAAGTSPTACELVVPPPTPASRAVTLKAVVHGLSSSAVPTGRVTFRKGGVVLGSATLDRTGTADFTLLAGTLAAGQHYISAYYEGDGRFAGDGGADLLVLTN